MLKSEQMIQDANECWESNTIGILFLEVFHGDNIDELNSLFKDVFGDKIDGCVSKHFEFPESEMDVIRVMFNVKQIDDLSRCAEEHIMGVARLCNRIVSAEYTVLESAVWYGTPLFATMLSQQIELHGISKLVRHMKEKEQVMAKEIVQLKGTVNYFENFCAEVGFQYFPAIVSKIDEALGGTSGIVDIENGTLNIVKLTERMGELGFTMPTSEESPKEVENDTKPETRIFH